MNHSWKGNVRELQHVLEAAMILGEGETISREHLSPELFACAGEAPEMSPLKDAIQRFERQHIVQVLEQSQFDKKEAARRLGISLASLYRKLDDHSA